jgi:predicted acetyltransferase
MSTGGAWRRPRHVGGMASHVRPCEPDELGLFLRTCAVAFGGALDDASIARVAPVFEPDRLFLALEDGEPVGSAGTLGLCLSVPGGEVRCGGVTMVGVVPGRRRQGVFRQLMERVLEEGRRRDEPTSVLWSTEGDLYGRFGYGLAATAARIDGARDRADLRSDGTPGAGVRLVDVEEAVRSFPPIYDAARATTPGMASRAEAWWRCWRLVGPPGTPADAPPMLRALVEVDGHPEAYALYRVHGSWETGVSTSQLDVLEAVGATARGTVEIWRFLFGLDLVERVRALHLPVDHPLFLLVREPARLRVTLTDALWVRLIDVAAALAARSYAQDGEAVLELSDPFCPWNDGRRLLVVSSAVGVLEPIKRPADVRLAATDLGSVYLGGITFERLARAGRLEEVSPGAVERLDAIFRSRCAPWCPEEF